MGPITNLNWKEIAQLVDYLRKPLLGASVGQITVPARKTQAEGYLKGEFLLRLERPVGALLFSVRPGQAYFTYRKGKEQASFGKATFSGFLMALRKHLKKRILQEVKVLPKERMVFFHFSQSLALVFFWVPARPECFLIKKEKKESFILSSSHGKEGVFEIPPSGNPPLDPPLRIDPKTWIQEMGVFLDQDGTTLRRLEIERELEKRKKMLQKKIKQAEETLRRGEQESDWLKFGDLLKTHMHELPSRFESKDLELEDFSTQKKVKISVDPRLSPKLQLEKFYSLAKKSKKKKQEALDRKAQFQMDLKNLEKHFSPKTPEEIEEAEQFLGLSSEKVEKRSKKPIVGKMFISQDGTSVVVGRNQKENLEVTFKFARGNDLWMHVRGRPSAHAVILLDSGKSASLETLLDAAQLLLHFSKGKNWGKVEVDYTFRKYVRRIKGSQKVSYSQNKTLQCEYDSSRLKPLLAKAK